MEGRHTHTFYFREKWETTTKPEHERVAHILRDTLSDTDIAAGFEDIVVKKFLRRLPKVQTSYKMKRGSRLTAVVYKWRKDGDKLTILFAFSTFVNRCGKEKFEKKALRSTALKRLEKNPHVLRLSGEVQDIPRYDRNETIKQTIGHIRKEMGVRYLTASPSPEAVLDANCVVVRKTLDWV